MLFSDMRRIVEISDRNGKWFVPPQKHQRRPRLDRSGVGVNKRNSQAVRRRKASRPIAPKATSANVEGSGTTAMVSFTLSINRFKLAGFPLPPPFSWKAICQVPPVGSKVPVFGNMAAFPKFKE